MPIAQLDFYYEKTSTVKTIYENALKFTSLADNNTISFPIYSNMSYSLDEGMTWTDCTSSTICTLDEGETVILVGNNASLSNNNFSSTGQVNVSGNPMSIISKSNFNNIVTLPTTDTFRRLFRGMQIVDASGLILKATTLTARCYHQMFSNCTSLTTAPALPATSLAQECYFGMFTNCSSLVTAPELPAVIAPVSCYGQMFQSCTSLINAPTLPATTLGTSCYNNMFNNCTSLGNAPILPATTLAEKCYENMFKNCTSLTFAPDLIAETLATDCYDGMFNGCSLLNYIRILATSAAESYLTSWVENVAPTGKFVKAADASYTIDSINGVPIGWTIFNDGDIEVVTYRVTLSESYDFLNPSDMSGAGVYTANSSVTVSVPASITDSNITYTFLGYKSSPNASNYVSTSNTYTFILTENVTLYPIFARFGTVYSTVSPEGYGQIFGSGTYVYGTYYTITMQPADGYRFIGYYDLSTDTLIDNTNPQSLTLLIDDTDGMTIVAKFEEIPVIRTYTITVNVNSEHGYILGAGTYNEGDICTLYAYPWNGYTFDYWNYNGVEYSTNSSISFTVDKDRTFTAVFAEETIPYATQYFTIEALEDNTSLYTNISVSPDGGYNLYYSKNGGEWSMLRISPGSVSFHYNNWICDLNRGDKVRFHANAKYINNYYVSDLGVISMIRTGSMARYYTGTNMKYKAYGNILSLVDTDVYTHPETFTTSKVSFTSENNKAFYRLFAKSYITDASNLILPDFTIDYCYSNMFLGCQLLTGAPELHATTLAPYCYHMMFYGCSQLTTAPALPATTLAHSCYSHMFEDCSLSVAPELPATTLAPYCYQEMFYHCTTLTTAPVLPATTLAQNCYHNMFYRCSSLTTAPALPATTLAENCYRRMFDGCTSLTTAPVLSATTLAPSCYREMFIGCTSLNYVKAMFTTDISDDTSYTYNWLANVAASGTFVKNSAATWNATGISGIPSGWTVQTASE